jgi:transcriptional antiterminator NusG
VPASSKTILRDGKIIVTDGLLNGQERNIIEGINRHKMRAVIELEMFGQTRAVTAGLEIVGIVL